MTPVTGAKTVPVAEASQNQRSRQRGRLSKTELGRRGGTTQGPPYALSVSSASNPAGDGAPAANPVEQGQRVGRGNTERRKRAGWETSGVFSRSFCRKVKEIKCGQGFSRCLSSSTDRHRIGKQPPLYANL